MAFAALLLILPGFATDTIGILLIFPYSRKLIINKFSKKYSKNKINEEKNFIDGEFEDMDDKDER